MRKALLLLFFLFITFTPSTNASRKISISTDKNLILENQELIISASASGFSTGEKIYLKGAFYKDGSTNYFGITKNGDTWIKNSATATDQRLVEVGSWNNLVSVKMDPSDSGFNGNGDYKFKLGFYYITGGGNVTSVNWSENNLDIKLEGATAIPTDVPTPKTTSTVKASTTSVKTTQQAVKTPTPVKISQISDKPTGLLIFPSPSKKHIKSVKIPSDLRTASQFASIKAITKPETDNKEVQILGSRDRRNDKTYQFSLLMGSFLLVISGIIVVRRFILKKGL
jgi:hypothetical protein